MSWWVVALLSLSAGFVLGVVGTVLYIGLKLLKGFNW